MPARKIDDIIKKKVMQDFNKGVSRAEIAEKYGISRSSIGRIIKAKAPGKALKTAGPGNSYDKAGAAERQKKIEDLERRIVDLEKRIQEMAKRRR